MHLIFSSRGPCSLSLHVIVEAYTKLLENGEESGFFFLCLLFCIFFVENASALLFQTFLSSNSKQALTPKIVTLILSCHLNEFKVCLQQIIDKDACAIFIETMKTFQFSVPETPLYSFLLPCLCTRSSIQFALHNAVVKIFLVLSSLFPPLLLCYLLQFSSLPFFCPLLLLFSVSLNPTLRKRATSPWILYVSKNSRTVNLIQK